MIVTFASCSPHCNPPPRSPPHAVSPDPKSSTHSVTRDAAGNVSIERWSRRFQAEAHLLLQQDVPQPPPVCGAWAGEGR